MAYMKTKQSKKIRNINTVGVTFINVSVIGSAMCSLICLETKKKSFQLLLFKNVSVFFLKNKRSKYKHMFHIKVKPRRYTV